MSKHAINKKGQYLKTYHKRIYTKGINDSYVIYTKMLSYENGTLD